MALSLVRVNGRIALAVNGHYLEVRTLLRHPLASLALLWQWLRASHDGSST